MWKKLRKKIRQRGLKHSRILAVALGAALTLTGGTPCAWAATEIGMLDSDGSFPYWANITWIGTESNHYTITGDGVHDGARAYRDGRITLAYTDISVTGGAQGIYATDNLGDPVGGTISLTHGSIKTEDATSVVADGNSSITLEDVAITTKGNSGFYSLYANLGGSITMTGGSIQKEGDNGVAAFAYASSSIALQDVTINSSTSWSNHGLYAIGGSICMTGGSITAVASDPQAYTIGAISDQNSTVTLKDVAITTYGLGGGVAAEEKGTLEMTGGSIITYNANAYGAWAGPNYWSKGGTIKLNDTSVQAAGIGLHAEGDSIYMGSITATVHGQNISGGTKLMEAGNYGFIELKGYNNSTLSGVTTLSGSGVANMSLNSGATWINPGDSTLTKLELNSGNVRFSAPATNTYHGLNVKDLNGSGTFYLNSNLGAGTSDLISVTGSASGSYQLVVTNQGGTSGIAKVVDIAAGAVNTAAFIGGGDSGAFRYKVAQGSALASTYSGLDSADYYFYNTLTPSTPSRAAIAQDTGIYSLWYSEMNDIKKRMGELRFGGGQDGDFWARTYGSEYKISPAGGDSYKQIVRGMEIGKDHLQIYSSGKKYTGFLVGSGQSDNSFQSGGAGNTDSFYLGAYSSWLRNDGSYLDLIGKYNWFDHDFTSPVLGGTSDKASFKNRGLGLSLEVGKRFEQQAGYFFEPQLELSAFWAQNADYTSANALHIATDRGRSLQLRLGCTAGKKWQSTDGTQREFYGKAAWVNEYAGDSTVRVETAAFDSSLKGHQWVTGIGYIEDGKRYQLYLDVEKSWGDTVSKAWGFNGGYRWKF